VTPSRSHLLRSTPPSEEAAEAHADGEYDHLEGVELHDRDKADSAGDGDDPRPQWGGFNVHRFLIPQFRFLPTPPPTPTANIRLIIVR